MALLYFYGWANFENYSQFCERNKTSPSHAVFIFPGNTGHHGKNHSLYSIKGGGGLASFTGSLGGKKLPVLSLPTTGMGKWSSDSKLQSLSRQAVEDLWKAAGAGYDLTLPVRDFDKSKQFFNSPLASKLPGSGLDIEPSFWGENLKVPNKPLADYYNKHLNLLARFMAVKDTDEEEDFLSGLENDHSTLVTAYRQGQAMKDDDPWLKAPGSKEILRPKRVTRTMNSISDNVPARLTEEETNTMSDHTENATESQSQLIADPNATRKLGIIKLLELFKKDDFETEGLFRVSPNETEKQRVIEALNKRDFSVLESIESTHLKAGVLKQLIRDLRDEDNQPIFNDIQRDNLLLVPNKPEVSEKIEAIKNVLRTLSPENKLIVGGLLNLNAKIIAQQDINKMTVNNLAIVQAPNLFDSKSVDPLKTLAFNEVIRLMIEHAEEFKSVLAVENSETIINDIENRTIEPAELTKKRQYKLLMAIKNEIEVKDWEVGLLGGVSVAISDNESKVMPHHVAKLYDICKNTTEVNVNDNFEQAKQVVNQRNIPKGPLEWIKYILKKLDVFNLFSRQKTTEAFYVSKQSIFKENSGDSPSEGLQESNSPSGRP